MKKFIRYFFLTIFAVTALGLVTAVADLAIARATLPATNCAVTEAQLDSLVLEKMSYADVRSTLGCSGVLVKKEDLGGQILLETYAWKGDVWPYGKFEGEFINGTLHGTSKTWLKLAMSGNTP